LKLKLKKIKIKKMEPISHDENNNPKSLGRIGYNTTFKNKIQFKNNFHSKKMARTPLKSKLNLMNTSQDQESINQKNGKMLKYPLLKSSSNINIHNKKNISYDIKNNEIYDYDEEDEDEYNKDALPDEINDFMHVNEKEINLTNDIDNNFQDITDYKKLDIKILDNAIYPYNENNNYVLAAHFDDSEDYKNEANNINKEINDFSTKKKFDDYFEEPDDEDIFDP
jgi:hypothetical protein